ncbi:hypothetical protein DFS34DRAFT_350314 [Phlyctochytrium arcticum]|nr:hypothetical protein DFS34DRAFT_350314 [Phlyctochytrium arcticum]
MPVPVPYNSNEYRHENPPGRPSQTDRERSDSPSNLNAHQSPSALIPQDYNYSHPRPNHQHSLSAGSNTFADAANLQQQQQQSRFIAVVEPPLLVQRPLSAQGNRAYGQPPSTYREDSQDRRISAHQSQTLSYVPETCVSSPPDQRMQPQPSMRGQGPDGGQSGARGRSPSTASQYTQQQNQPWEQQQQQQPYSPVSPSVAPPRLERGNSANSAIPSTQTLSPSRESVASLPPPTVTSHRSNTMPDLTTHSSVSPSPFVPGAVSLYDLRESDLSDTFKKMLPYAVRQSLSLHPMSRAAAFFSVLDEMYCTELRYVETLQSIMEVYVRPLIAPPKGRQVLKEDSIKIIFASLSPLHLFSVQWQNEVKAALEMAGEGNMVECTLRALDALTPTLYQLYNQYAENFCATLWEVHKCMRENAKFRDFCAHAQLDKQCGGRSLYELMKAPYGRLTQYSMLFTGKPMSQNEVENDCNNKLVILELVEAGQVPEFLPAVSDVTKLSADMAAAQDNWESLILMLVHIAGVPPAMILKRGQILLLEDTVDKVKVSSSGNVTSRKPVRLYLLRDALIITKLTRETTTAVSVADLVSAQAKVAKLPKPTLQYRTVELRDFIKAETAPGRDGM